MLDSDVASQILNWRWGCALLHAQAQVLAVLVTGVHLQVPVLAWNTAAAIT
jgi:hypothetical protein